MAKERASPYALVQTSNGAVARVVSSNRFAIGYIGLGYIKQNIKPVAVNGVPGTGETALSGEYPLSRPLFMFTRGWPAGDALSFINYIQLTRKGQKLVNEVGFVPLF